MNAQVIISIFNCGVTAIFLLPQISQLLAINLSPISLKSKCPLTKTSVKSDGSPFLNFNSTEIKVQQSDTATRAFKPFEIF